MPLNSGIYDWGVISPVAKIRENLSIFTSGQWSHYRIEFIEGMPYSSPMVVEMVTASGVTTIAANGSIAAQVVNILQLNEKSLLHLRFEPLDDVEGVLWEEASVGRFVTRGVHARVTRFSAARDPNLAATTFFILGRDRDMELEVRNPLPVAQAVARFVFWGYRYGLKALDETTSKRIMDFTIPSTWLPAEGRGL